jgi:hypothetical protein
LWTFWRDSGGLAAVRGSSVVRGASLGELEIQLAAYDDCPRRSPAVLSREFPDWQFDVYPGASEICTAFWCSPDGRSRRYIVAWSTAELLARLRIIGPGAVNGC